MKKDKRIERSSQLIEYLFIHFVWITSSKNLLILGQRYIEFYNQMYNTMSHKLSQITYKEETRLESMAGNGIREFRPVEKGKN